MGKMMQISSSAVAGLSAGALFFLVGVLHLGFLFMLLPALPLFYIGLSQGMRPMVTATTIATLCILPIGGLGGVLFFLVFAAWPSLQLARDALANRKADAMLGDNKMTIRQWYPLGMSFVKMACVISLVTLFTCVFLVEGPSVDEQLQNNVREGVQQLEPELQEVMVGLTSTMSFAVIAMSLWLWMLLVYLHGWIAHKMLEKRGTNLRPGFGISAFIMPGWMLQALTLAGVASLFGSANLAFAGKVSLIVLLLPYFLLGMALIHDKVRNSPSGGVILFMLYFFLMAQAWPMLAIAGYGVWHHCREMFFKPTA